ncbi:MAG: PIG-L deacetylase family protein [Candidatus Bathyarchaeia archaeon]
MIKTILVIEPHPDDGAIMAGGTVAKMVREGKDVFFVTVTDGERGTMNRNIKTWDQLREITRKEASDATKILGVKDSFFLGYPNHDVTFELEKELKEKFIRIIRKVKPDIVMTYDPYAPYEPNPDHRTVAFAAYDAVTFSHHHLECPQHLEEGLDTHIVKEIWFFNSPNANLDIDISDVIWIKVKAIAAYKSQIEAMIEEVKERLKATGFRAPVLEGENLEEKIFKLWIYPSMENGKFVEKFKVIKPFISERVGHLIREGLIEPIKF